MCGTRAAAVDKECGSRSNHEMIPRLPADLSQLSHEQKDALIVALLARIEELAAQVVALQAENAALSARMKALLLRAVVLALAADLRGDRADRRILRAVLALVVQNHPHRALADFR